MPTLLAILLTSWLIIHVCPIWCSGCSLQNFKWYHSSPTRLLCPWDLPGKSTGVGCHRLLWTVTKRYTQTQNRVKLVLTPNTYLTHFSYFSPLLPFLSNVSEAPDKEIFWRFQIDFILCLCSENKIMRRKLQSLFRISLTFPKMLIEVKSWISPVFCITAS